MPSPPLLPPQVGYLAGPNSIGTGYIASEFRGNVFWAPKWSHTSLAGPPSQPGWLALPGWLVGCLAGPAGIPPGQERPPEGTITRRGETVPLFPGTNLLRSGVLLHAGDV